MRFVAEQSPALEVGAVTLQTGEPYCAAGFRLALFPVWNASLSSSRSSCFDPTCLSSPGSFYLKTAPIPPQSKQTSLCSPFSVLHDWVCSPVAGEAA